MSPRDRTDGPADLDLATALEPTDQHGLETISSDPSAIRGAFGKFPSGATAVIEFDTGQWTDVDWGSGRLADFVEPKQFE